jgi:NDP-sugar pyrophosphorylase family protein
LEHNIDKLCEADVRKLLLVIPQSSRGLFEEATKRYEDSVEFTFVEQEKPSGTAQALGLVRRFIPDSTFFLCYGDNLTHYSFLSLIATHKRYKSDATMALVEASDPTKHGVAEVDAQNQKVVNLVEKPKHPKSNLVFAGMCVFEPIIFEAILKTPPSQSGEYYLTDSIRILINLRNNVFYDKVDQWRMNVNTHWDLLIANSHLLNGFGSGENRENKENKEYLLLPPAYVSNEAEIGSGAVVGPYVSLHGRVKVGRGVKIQNSILMDGANIEDQRAITDSIIGDSFELKLHKS